MRFKALHQFTGRLPMVALEGRMVPLGKDTDTAIRAGVLKGIEYEISGYITVMKHKYPELLVFVTGGDDFSFDTNLKSIIFADRDVYKRQQQLVDGMHTFAFDGIVGHQGILLFKALFVCQLCFVFQGLSLIHI